MKTKSISMIIVGLMLLTVSPLGNSLLNSAQGKVSYPIRPAPQGDTQFGFSRDVVGTLVVTTTNAMGCGGQVCTTNTATFSGCVTNATGGITCSNKTVTTIVCTNGVTTVTAYKLHESLSGTITANVTCDELGNRFPASATFQAQIDSDVRLGDWRGLHTGTFLIMDGATLVASGTLSGSNGVGSHGALGEACAVCNHMEGTLVGTVLSGTLSGAQIQATYAADLTAVTCPSANIPAGAVTLTLDGVVVSRNCPAP